MQQVKEKNGGDGINRPLDALLRATAHRQMAGAEKQALHHDLNQRGRRASMRSFKDLVETKAELIRGSSALAFYKRRWS